MSISALFLDRDGTLVEDKGYVHKLKDFKLKNGVIEGLKLAQKKGYKLFIITNQGGVSLKKFTIIDMNLFNKKLTDELLKNEIHIIEIKYCIHHPKAIKKEMRTCDCRKPSPKMIFDLCDKYNIDIKKSFMIGNSSIDIETGKNAGCNTILVKDDKFFETISLKLLEKGF